MSSLNQHLNDVADADEVVGSRGARHALSTSKESELRTFLLGDSYAFTYVVCRHRDMVPEIHMPISYAACGLTDKLIWILDQSGFESYVIDQLRAGLRARNIDPSTPTGRTATEAVLDYLNFRISRGTFKSSVITHGGATFVGTVDPNTTAKITHAVDDKAWAFCEQIAETVRSGIYRDLFPDRIPKGNMNELVTMKQVTLGGRTISHPQTTIQAGGYTTKDTSAHYDTFWTDDLVVEGNASPTVLPTVHRWLRNMPGLFMLTRRVRRIHVGTTWDDYDDHWFLTTGNRATACFTVFVPIETHDKPVTSILERGTPTMPTFIPKAKVQQIQDSVLSADDETDGARSWRCNYLLNPGAMGARLFPAAVVDDLARRWTRLAYERDKEHPTRFRVRRLLRDAEGMPTGKTLELDPWSQMDRVLTLDASWKDGGDNWAVGASGFDYDGVQYELRTLSDNNGVDGWIDAMLTLDAAFKPRVIGFDAGAYQDDVIQNMMRTDRRLSRMRSRMRPVKHHGIAKTARIRAGLAEPLAMYRFLGNPGPEGQPTRDEMKGYRIGDKNATDGIIDMLSMAPAVSLRRESPDEKKKRQARRAAEERTHRDSYDPTLGVSLVA